MSLEILGMDAFRSRLRLLEREIPAVAGAVLTQEAERIMTDAKRRTPVDTGALRASGQVAPPDVTATGASIELGFGGPAVGYAVPVHENVTARHPTGEAKYLERAIDAARGGLEARLNAALARELRRLAGG